MVAQCQQLLFFQYPAPSAVCCRGMDDYCRGKIFFQTKEKSEMSKETIKFSDKIEISCSENTLIIQEKPLKNSEWILMHLVLIGSILLGIAALCIALLLPFAEISLLSILLALMFLLFEAISKVLKNS